MKILTNQPIQKKSQMRKPRKQMKKRERFNFKRYLLLVHGGSRKRESSGTLLHSLSLSACLIFLFYFILTLQPKFWCNNKTKLDQTKVLQLEPFALFIQLVDMVVVWYSCSNGQFSKLTKMSFHLIWRNQKTEFQMNCLQPTNDQHIYTI